MIKVEKIFENSLPVLLMIALIAFIESDYILSILFIFIIVSVLLKRYEKNDLLIFVFGFFIMIFFEYIFVMTGVEVFRRNTLFGMMPLWLPILWGYGFIAIKRSVKVLDE